MNGCTDTCEDCGDDFIPTHDEAICRKCADVKEEERAWIQHGLPNCGMTKRDLFRVAYWVRA